MRRRASFSRRYRVTMGATVVVLLAAAAGVFAVQVREHAAAERARIEDRLKEHVMILDVLLGMADERAADLQREAEMLARLPAPAGGVGQVAPLEGADGGFRLVAPDPALDQGLAGVIVGQTPPDPADEGFWRELALAVRLDDALQRARERLPMATSVYYLSARGFGLLEPGALAEPARALAALREGGAWRRAGGATGSRRPFWTSPAAGPDGTPQISVAAPVWSPDRFLGVVAIDVSLDYFARVNADLAYPLGEAVVVSRAGEVVIRPAVAGEEAAARADAGLLRWLEMQPARRLVESDGNLLYHQDLGTTGWRLVYAVPRRDVLGPILADRGLQAGLLAAVLLVMLAIASRLTRKDFIEPAGHLVAHIEATGRLERRPVPRVPPGWRPWFETVSRIFRENSQLAALRQELAIARQMQLSILPRALPEREDLAVDGRTQPATEVGGDFYDHFFVDERHLAVAVADVSGKGVAAGLFAMIARTLLKSEGLAGHPPQAVLERVNNALARENEQMLFVTVFFGVLDLETGELAFANAGHGPPYLVDAAGTPRALEVQPGIALGIVEDAPFAPQRATIGPGEKLVLYTDGITEAFSADGGEYTKARLEASLARAAAMPPVAIISRVIADVEQFAIGAAQADDITCLVVHRKAVG